MMRAFLRLRASGVTWLAGAPQGTPHCIRNISSTSAALPPWPPGDAANDADDADALARASSSLPPAYYSAAAAALDASRVFRPAWLYAGPAAWVEKPGDYFTIGGRSGGGAVPRAVVARAPDGVLRALSNVCRHRAAPVATRPRGNRIKEMQEEGEGRASSGAGACAMAWVCGYHGWQYSPEGRLARAPKMGGVERLSARRLSLAPLDVDVLGPLVFVRRRRGGEEAGGGDNDSDGRASSPRGLEAWLGPEGAAAAHAVVSGAYASSAASSSSSTPPPPPSSDLLLHVARREWRLECDWKVFADNFLDGGYHVPCAHPGLADGLDLGTYAHALHGPRVSVQTVQSCARAAAASSSSIAGKKERGGDGGGSTNSNNDNGSSSSSRLGRRAAYAWVFPNVALNRYGPWLDVNAVVPDGPGRCRVTFDWFLEAGAPGAAAAAAAADALSSSSAPPPFDEQLRALPEGVAEALLSSCRVQEEDVALCEGVQAGLDEAVACAGGGGPPVYGSPSVVGAGGEDCAPLGGGRYAMREGAMYHFHRALWAEYRRRGE